jgi:hypothetical protein
MSRQHEKKARLVRRLLGATGAGAGALLAAAAMATGSAMTATPAHADFEDLLEPIVQPLLTHAVDAISTVDPAAALDLTSWTDSLLASLSSIDVAAPTADSALSAAATGLAEPAVSAAGGTIPITVLEGTEPAVYATIGDGTSAVPLLVDTGSSGLVIPESDLGANNFWQLLMDYGLPSSFGSSGYSGGVDYIYLTYDNINVDYGDFATTGPVDVEVYSWEPGNFLSLFTNDAFQNFLGSNQVDGILGIGENTAGPTTTPFETYGSVLVDIPHGQLVVGGGNPFPDAVSTAGTPVSTVYESIDGTFEGATKVTNIIDSGGVFGTIPSSLATSVPAGTEITVFNAAGQELYSYPTTGAFDIGGGTLVNDAPTVVSGSTIDSGVIPFLNHAVYIDYAADKTFFGPLAG